MVESLLDVLLSPVSRAVLLWVALLQLSPDVVDVHLVDTLLVHQCTDIADDLGHLIHVGVVVL